MIVARA